MKNKSTNNTAFQFSIFFLIGVYLILLVYINKSTEPLNEVVLVLIPIIMIEFSKSIYEALADKKDLHSYEREKKTLGVLSPLTASLVILAYIIISIIDPDNSSSDVALFFTSSIIIIYVLFLSIYVINKIVCNKAQEVFEETPTKEALNDENVTEEVDVEQRKEKYQKEKLESDFNGDHIKSDNPPLNGDNKNDIDKSQLTFLIGIVLLILSIVMKLFSKDRSYSDNKK